MKNRFFTVITLLVFLVTLTGNAQAKPPDSTALVYVNLSSSSDLDRFATTQLPLYAMLDGGLLTSANEAGEQVLREAGLSFQVLDPDLRSGHYYQAETHPSRPAPDFSLYGRLLLSTDSSVLLRMDPAQADALTQAGAELRLITLDPKPIPSAQAEGIFPDVVEPDPLIQVMMDQVTSEDVSQYDRELAGELPVWVDGEWYTISTRYTYSGTPIQKATSYFGQHMADLGMEVEYHAWNNSTNPNVIGEIPGLVNPEDIFIIGGHIDDVQGTPGADDNASGSVAAMVAADILSQYQWGCTLRFAVWTGEEQGLNGSQAYAQRAYNNGDNILGYLNLDMIAWNTIGSPNTIYLGYGSSVPPSHELALLFADVVDAYDIDLLPVIGTAYSNSSDHGSFLQYGYPAILGIEGDDDFNPYYHGPGDTPAHTDLAYFTTYVKASIATFAHMSGCLIPSGVGSLDGQVTAASGGNPIQDATVTADDGLGHNFSTTTDETGYYTRTLLAGTYDVTASAYSYLPSTVSGVEIVTDTVTTQDFSLVAAPTHVVSGVVTETGTGAPLLAKVSFDESPDVVWTNPSTGYYEAELPEGSYTMQVTAALHASQQRDIVLDQDQTQNFTLDPLPCILLVDDDQDNPDVRSYYTNALDDLGYDYDIWDVSAQGSPAAEDIAGYLQLMWFNGYPYSSTFTGENEAAVSAYLDAGGNFFLSGQDYLYEMGLTSFGQSYLHIASYSSDVNQTSVTGQNVFDGLGPYSLSYPFTNYSDIVNPDGQAQLAFSGNVGNAAVSFDGETFKTVFLGYPFEALPEAGASAVMARMVDEFFGGCEPPPPPEDVYIYPPAQEGFGDLGMQISYVYTVTNDTLGDQDISLAISDNVWQTEAPASTGMLLAGESVEITVTVDIPNMLEATPIGSDTFTLTAVGDVVGEATASGTTVANVNPDVEVVAPSGDSGRPLGLVGYEFTVTNMGDYTDSFTLEVSGVWTATLPGGANTGQLAIGASATVFVIVEIPADAVGGATDVTTLTAVSDLDAMVTAEASVTTTAEVMFNTFLPVLRK